MPYQVEIISFSLLNLVIQDVNEVFEAKSLIIDNIGPLIITTKQNHFH